jgi:hypothetical protein
MCREIFSLQLPGRGVGKARRLRRKLAEYYARAGCEDAIEIRLPKRGYLPTFETRPRSMVKSSVAVLPSRIISTSPAQAGERFRCDSQLVCSSNGLHLWAGSFDARRAPHSRWSMSELRVPAIGHFLGWEITLRIR